MFDFVYFPFSSNKKKILCIQVLDEEDYIEEEQEVENPPKRKKLSD